MRGEYDFSQGVKNPYNIHNQAMRANDHGTSTLAYYDTHADSFTTDTLEVKFTETQDEFLSHIQPGGRILDFGCGAGRDTRYFLSRGYNVDAIDGSEKLCELARQNTGIDVKQMYFDELDKLEIYDGIWTCASILHLDKTKMKPVIRQIIRATKPRGYIYISYKHGTYEGYRGDRYYTDFTIDSFTKYIDDVDNITIEKYWISHDVRPGRGDELWLNILLRKSHTN